LGCNSIVTAASQGLGYAAAEALAERGCNLLIASRDKKSISLARKKISEKYKVEVIDITTDLRNEKDVKKLIDEAFNKFKAIDVVVMNYGNPSCEPCELTETTWSDWIEAASMYIASSALVSKGLILRNSKKTTMIIISSFTVIEPSSYLIISDVVRSGLTRLAKILARKYSDKLKTIVLLLGSFKTPGAIKTISKIARVRGETFESFWKRKVEELSPLRRSGKIEEFKKIISWLALDSPEYLTGTSIVFDGSTTRGVII